MTDKEWADYWRDRCAKAELLLMACQAVAEAHSLYRLSEQLADHFKELARGSDAASSPRTEEKA